MIRLATENDIAQVASIYDLVLRQEEQGLTSIGWQRQSGGAEQLSGVIILLSSDSKLHKAASW